MKITTAERASMLLLFGLALSVKPGASVGDHLLATENGTLLTSVGTNTSLDTSYRHSKFLFPIYTVVRFSNTQCSATNGLLGTCYLRTECTSAGGTAFGNCARRLGVCCVVRRNCGGAVTSSNNTYFQSPTGFPANSGATGSRCTISINKTTDSLCYVRLNLMRFTLLQPDGNGTCLNDSLTVTGTDTVVPRICGDNAGQIIYLKFQPDGSPIQVSINTNSSINTERAWDILVSQHSCSEGPQNNCLQYFTETRGNVRSFNYADTMPAGQLTRQLANQQYAICVRPASGYCGILWEQANSRSFTVSNDTGGIAPELLGEAAAMEKGDRCNGDFIVIPNAMQNNKPIGADRLCGNTLLPTTSMMTPMVLTVVNDDTEVISSTTSDVINRGFSINYRQIECVP